MSATNFNSIAMFQVPLPALVYVCGCSLGNRLDQDGVCEKTPNYWNPARIAAVLVADFAFSVLMLLGIRFCWRRYTRLKYDVALHQVINVVCFSKFKILR